MAHHQTSSRTVDIRFAIPKDAPVISKVLLDAFREFEPLYTPKGFAATALDADQVLARMHEGPVWVACCDAAVIGTVAAVKKNESAYIRGMAVVPAARGLDIGARLLQTVEQWSMRKSCTRLFLSTTPFLLAAIRLYERSGFRRMTDSDHDLFGTPLLTMEKPIPS